MYTVLAEALARAKERSGATSADDVYLTELLTLSAGKAPDAVTHYRPFYCAAKWMEQDKAKQALKKAGDVEFTGLAAPISSLVNLQASLDQALELTIPKGFEAIPPECQTCDNQKPQPRYRTQSHSTSSRP